MTLFAIAVALDQVTSPGARARSDDNALFAADKSAANAANDGADNGAFSAAMVYPAMASLLGEAIHDERAEYQSNTQEDHGHRTFSVRNFHF